jgi:hypothetical protein
MESGQSVGVARKRLSVGRSSGTAPTLASISVSSAALLRSWRMLAPTRRSPVRCFMRPASACGDCPSGLEDLLGSD